MQIPHDLSAYPSHQPHWPRPENFICCDHDHRASSSTYLGPGAGAGAVNGEYKPQLFNSFNTNYACNDTEACHSDCPLETYCRGGDYCTHTAHTHDDCGGMDICNDPSCDDTTGKGCGVPCDNHTDCGSLQNWADTEEGCHAIQQLLECCNQPNCDLPICTTNNETVHPPPVDPLAALFESMASQPVPDPIPPVSTPVSQADGALHTCHWGNCHLVFRSMPDLLAHVAADHLSAWGQSPRPLQPQPPAPTPVHIAPTQPVPTMSFPTPMSVMDSSSYSGSSAIQTPTSAAADQLLSCLWDDCFPQNEFAPTADTYHHQHHHSQPQQQQLCHETNHQQSDQVHTHDHTGINGEPYSPGTMLRHVLEEHLGVPGEIIGWPNEPQPTSSSHGQITSAATTNAHHHHHHVPHHHLPTPPSTTSSTSSSSSPLSKAHLHTCLWPGCPIRAPFPNAATLMDHLSEVHIPTGKDSYICHWDGCGGEHGKVFKSRQKVLRHLQSHTGHKPFVCGVCDQGFSEAAPLAAHMRRHAQEKPFKCEHPGCGKTFAISSSLTIHMRTHNGEKPFICQYCNKGFIEASNLTKHIRTHTGEKPFACAHPGCGKRFPRPDQLKRHMSVHDKVMGYDKRKLLTAG